MTKKSVKAEVSTFVRGLVTEASPLNFPENASLSEENFELLVTGARQRRLGLDFEEEYSTGPAFVNAVDMEGDNIFTYVWKSAGGVVDKDILVVQLGSTLEFYDLREEFLSRDGFITTILLAGIFDGTVRYSFTTVDGYLILANGSSELLLISGIEPGTYEKFSLKVRDMWGVEYTESDEDPYFRPPLTAPAAHFYNLYNQSWGIPRRWEGAGNMMFTDPVGYYASQYSRFPSSSETVWTAITMKPGDEPYEYMRPNAWAEVLGSVPTAAKGYFIIDALKRGQSRTAAVEKNKLNFPDIGTSTFATNADVTPNGANVVFEFAGRVFYAGFSGEVIEGDSKSPKLSSYILFSQLVNSRNDLSKCYQEGDPTSREGSDIVDTDGGLIRISGLDRVIRMEGMGSNLIVIANNGVWAISGGSDYGFTATNYKVNKLTNLGCLSHDSVVKAGDTVFYWGTNGIYSVAFDQTGQLVVTSITDKTINTFYSEISSMEKVNCSGIYDDVSKTVRWIYYENRSISNQTQVNELVLDMRLQAFYKHKISNTALSAIRGLFAVPNIQTQNLDVQVIAEADTVIANTDNVIVASSQRIPSKSSVRYLMFFDNASAVDYTFGYYKEGGFRDWFTKDGVGIDAKAHLLTGAITANDSSVDKQVPYVTVHMYRTENGVDEEMEPTSQSGCLMSSQWEWANSVNSNKWGRSQQVYRYRRGYLVNSASDPYDTGFELITTKNKLRGMGRAVSLYFETEPLKDCRLVGWNLNINGNSVT